MHDDDDDATALSLQAQLEEIYELLVGSEGMQRFTHEELMNYISNLKNFELIHEEL